jgi:RNA polymerase sigma-70 factor, ECF subfamily
MMTSASDSRHSSRPARNEENKIQQELFTRIANDDHDAFKTVFHLYYSQLRNFAQRFVTSHEVANELVQNVFEKLWMKRYEIEIHTSLKAYLYKGVRNQALDYIKHREVVRRWEEDPQSEEYSHQSIEDELHKKELLREVERAIETLPDKRRTIFLLHWKNGLTYKEIADVLGISVKTVEVQMGRSLKTIRSLFQKYLPHFTAFVVISLLIL